MGNSREQNVSGFVVYEKLPKTYIWLFKKRQHHMKIYHNPRCSKSREGLGILQESGKEFQTVEYLKTPPSEDEIREILKKLDIPAEALVRKNEVIWKENYKGKKLSEEEIIQAMAENPKLIERPIVVGKNGAVIGRPPSLIEGFIK
jgi:arsenate reductase